MSRPVPWTIADLLDFEYLLATETGADAAEAQVRDRALIAEKLEALTRAGDPPDRRAVFKHYLEAHRARDGAALPGGYFMAGWHALLTLAVLGGLAVGVSLTAGLLHYKGNEPVNVAWFFAWTVGLQLLVLFAAFVVWVLRRTLRLFDDFGPLRWLLAGLLWSLSAGLRRLPGEQRERLRAGLARISHRREIYGSLATWPLLVVTQLFGVCFNLGVLATLLLHVALSDVAFGWQSTLRTSPEEAYRVASALAAPWAWAPNAHPTLDQVVASRFAYSEGIKPLSPKAMASWWPFLCYAVVFYGLLVRTLLLAWAVMGLRRTLASLEFNHQGCNALFRRLTGPIVQAQDETASLQIPQTSASPARHAVAGGSCFTLVGNDLSLSDDELAARLQSDYGWRLTQTLHVEIDHPSANAEMFDALGKAAPGLDSVVILVRAKRSPIKAIALFLKKVVTTADAKPEVLLLLVGRREGEHFLPVGDEEFAHWRNFSAIHGLPLEVEKWRPG